MSVYRIKLIGHLVFLFGKYPIADVIIQTEYFFILHYYSAHSPLGLFSDYYIKYYAHVT
jgi:hypothetical protein